jgi:hypothetical protein
MKRERYGDGGKRTEDETVPAFSEIGSLSVSYAVIPENF